MVESLKSHLSDLAESQHSFQIPIDSTGFILGWPLRCLILLTGGT